MNDVKRLAERHVELTRRYFLGLSAAGAAALGAAPLWAREEDGRAVLDEAIARLEYLTLPDDFRVFGRGNPPPHTLPLEKRRAVGLVPEKVEAGQPVAVTGVAQVGMSGLSKVQYWLCPEDSVWPEDDPYFAKAPWQEAEVLPPPKDWGGGLPRGELPATPRQVDPASGKPHTWPLRGTIVHWAALIADPAPGRYDLRCRTIDANGMAQPMPRPFPKSGHNVIQRVRLIVFTA